MTTIEITMDEAKRILDWRAAMAVGHEKEHSQPEDDALMSRLLDFVDDR